MQRETRIDTGTGVSLGATIHESASPRAVVVLNPAMGVTRSLYEPFAGWLADQGCHVVSWSYSGTGDSGDPREINAHIHDWGERDLDAVLAWGRENWPDLPLVIVAHSVGGQVIGMAENSRKVDAIISIASQSGYWKHYHGFQRWRIAFFWFLFIPLVCRLVRAFPGRSLGLAAHDIPVNATRQWARWGRDPEYLMGRHRRPSASGYARIDCPLLAVWIADDDLATHDANRAMLSWYRSAGITTLDLHPEAEGLERIGHFGFFRPERGQERLWPHLADWLDTVLDRRIATR